MSYRGKSKGHYGNQHRNRSVASVQAARSQRAREMDSRLKAPIAKNPEQWMNTPNRFDLSGIDTPKGPIVSKKQLERAHEVKEDFDKDGHWVTINGQHVWIKEEGEMGGGGGEGGQNLNTPNAQLTSGEKMKLESSIIDSNKIDYKEQQFRTNIKQSFIESDKRLSAMNHREQGTFQGVSVPMAVEKQGADFREFVKTNYMSATLSAASQPERLNLANELHQINGQLNTELLRVANEELDKLKRGM